MILGRVISILLFFSFTFIISCDNKPDLDSELQEIIKKYDLQPVKKYKPTNEYKYLLGKLLFFDQNISGNRDISCSTCHLPDKGTVDCLPLGAGTKGIGLCENRVKSPDREFVPRNSLHLFGKAFFDVIFWDGRIQKQNGKIITPAGDQTPEGLESPLAAQALFPITSRTEMRGKPGDIDINGDVNEIALVEDGNFIKIWNLVMKRIMEKSYYRELFKLAYPDKDNFTIVDYANAVGEFEAVEFSSNLYSPWDRYLSGNKNAISEKAKKGAILFFTVGCANCHSGNLFSDQKFHNIGVPQLGSGKDKQTGLDFGRYHVTGNENDKFKFRTPSLRNVMVTKPYFHNGCYDDLLMVIKHHINPEYYLKNYDPRENNISDELAVTLKNDKSTINQILSTIDVDLPKLTDDEINLIIEFLKTLTSTNNEIQN